jgi:hypothetical protein
MPRPDHFVSNAATSGPGPRSWCAPVEAVSRHAAGPARRCRCRPHPFRLPGPGDPEKLAAAAQVPNPGASIAIGSTSIVSVQSFPRVTRSNRPRRAATAAHRCEHRGTQAGQAWGLEGDPHQVHFVLVRVVPVGVEPLLGRDESPAPAPVSARRLMSPGQTAGTRFRRRVVDCRVDPRERRAGTRWWR